MEMADFDRDYQIENLTIRRVGRETSLEWRYKRGTHFLVLLYDSRRQVELSDLIYGIEQKGIDDAAAVAKGGGKIYMSADEAIKVFLLQETRFAKSSYAWMIPAAEIRRGIPYGVSVFTMVYERVRGVLHIYPASAPEDNTQYIAVNVRPEIRYKRQAFLREKTCILHIPYLQGYTDGALEYFIDTVGIGYPLPASCMGQQLVITVPEDGTLYVRAADHCKKYYRILGG